MTPAWPCVWEAQVVEAYDKDAFHGTLPGQVESTLTGRNSSYNLLHVGKWLEACPHQCIMSVCRHSHPYQLGGFFPPGTKKSCYQDQVSCSLCVHLHCCPLVELLCLHFLSACGLLWLPLLQKLRFCRAVWRLTGIKGGGWLCCCGSCSA